jgi:NADPH:quinone reductase-like Zn-dependent oxidoreductase
MRGEPRIARIMDKSIFGRTGPRVRTRGTDFAGVVEAVGPGVTQWKPGDRIFGEADAALAEFVVASVDSVAPIPAGVTTEQAAALPLAATTALDCMRAGNPQPGAAVLINGASGGVGTFAVQLAKSMGLHVTAVCSERNADLARSLGADQVIDYTRQDFVSSEKRYDVVVDLVGNKSLRDLRRAVTSSGNLVLSGGGVSGKGRIVGPVALLLRAQLTKHWTEARIFTPQAKPTREVLEDLTELVAAGAITPIVDRTFGFEDAADALRYLEEDHARAKVIVTSEGA